MPRLTHTISPAALDAIVTRNLSDREARELAASIGTAFALLEPGAGRFAIAYALGQMAHESAEFVFTREIWGPTAVQAGYWRRRELQGPGPLFPALSFRYRGGGWIQTTGRNNYRHVAAILRGVGVRARSARSLAAHGPHDRWPRTPTSRPTRRSWPSPGGRRGSRAT